MSYFEWTGKDGDTSPFGISSSGTGQSGTAVVDSTPGLIYSNAQTIKVTSQTSSGSGACKAQIFLPRPVVRQQLKVGMRVLLQADDANFSTLNFLLFDYNGTQEAEFFYRIFSNHGSTEEIQYLNGSAAYVDLGFNYPQDSGVGGKGWHYMEMDIDLESQRFDMLRFDGETSLGSKAVTVISSVADPSLRLDIEIQTTTNLCTFYIDEVWVQEL